MDQLLLLLPKPYDLIDTTPPRVLSHWMTLSVPSIKLFINNISHCHLHNNNNNSYPKSRTLSIHLIAIIGLHLRRFQAAISLPQH
jgi:hypothetical protein